MIKREYKLTSDEGFGVHSQSQNPGRIVVPNRGWRVVGLLKRYDRNFMIMERRSIFGIAF